MEKYNYLESVKEDVREYIREEISLGEYAGRRDELEENLNDTLWIVDSVTGNASGSYYCNSWKAAESLCHNWDLLEEALEEFGCEKNAIENGEEWCDVTIRCYLLGHAISKVLDELEESGELKEEEDGEE